MDSTQDPTKTASSYQKGIDRLLLNKANFESLIIEYLLTVNSKYRSNMFPTPQIAKILLDKLKMKKTQFPILHKIVRTILAEWEKQNFCEYITTTKSGRNRRTKFIYRFNPDQIQFLKGRFITSSINQIEQEITNENKEPLEDILKSRENILEDWLASVKDEMEDMDVQEAESVDKEALTDSETDIAEEIDEL